MNWSGGKDSALCLYKALKNSSYNVTHLLTNINAAFDRVSMHGVRRSLLQAQANAIELPLVTVELPGQPTMQEYEAMMMKQVNALKSNGCTHAIFGDIFLEDLKKYREEKLQQADVQCLFPLWKIDTKALMKEFLSKGFKAIVVCVNEKFLDKSFCGRIIDEAFVNDLPATVDVCGENGEYHSFVFDGSVFKTPVSYTKGEIVRKEYASPVAGEASYGFYFCDLLPV